MLYLSSRERNFKTLKSEKFEIRCLAECHIVHIRSPVSFRFSFRGAKEWLEGFERVVHDYHQSHRQATERTPTYTGNEINVTFPCPSSGDGKTSRTA